MYQQIKLALDVHAGDLMVVRMMDGAKPQPPQKLTTERFLDWAAKQKAQLPLWTEPSAVGFVAGERIEFSHVNPAQA